jgi:D-alanine-D-alanine ligase-like ATP-grasp enzyme
MGFFHSTLQPFCFQAQVQEIMKTVFLASKNQLDCRVGFFDLLGFDIMLDENMKLWLIEVNVNPALFTNCAVLQFVCHFFRWSNA